TVTTPAMTAQTPSTMSTVSLAWMLVIGVRLMSAPRTARKIHRNMTGTRSPIARRSASNFSSRTLARSSCWRWLGVTTAGMFIGILLSRGRSCSPEATIHTRDSNFFARCGARNEPDPRYFSTQVSPALRSEHAGRRPKAPAGRTTVRHRQAGQSLVEFAISSIVLLLLVMGLLDLSRAFYFSVNIQGAAREGARHGAWFNTAARNNNFLDDTDVMSAVNAGLNGAGLTANQVP